MISAELKKRAKLYPGRQYQLAHKVGILPCTLSKLVNGIDLVNEGDPRVIRVGEVLGLPPEKCFTRKEKLNHNQSKKEK